MPEQTGATTFHLGKHRDSVQAALARLDRQRFLDRFLAKDPTLWKTDDETARVVRNRMGWLDVAAMMRDQVAGILRFADQLRGDGFKHVVLLGMGGSSLCPDVLRQTFRRGRGRPLLHVLDSTDPEAIAAVDRAIDPEWTLFVVSSKSGTTIESQMLFRYYWAKSQGERFIAITDPGTPLERIARERGFRRVFLNPPDIGGRYSALSYFGMVPAACAGIDIGGLLERGDELARGLRPGLAAGACEPVALGAALAALAGAGRDKVTFVTSRSIATFGYWVEQLIAESTGKEGKGLIPIEGEELGRPSEYGKDRCFVHLRVRGSSDVSLRRRLTSLRRAGHPVIQIDLEDRLDLGAEFNRWEIATATAASLMGINPFDEPNVKESKDNSARALETFQATGSFSSPVPALDEGVRALARLIESTRKGDYIALMAYLRMDAPTVALLGKLRLKLRRRCRAATTLGFGPRFLHSTGQLHKGGPPNGVFIQITSEKALDLPIPGESFSFKTLEAAQAAGDLRSLEGRGYRVARLHLGASKKEDLERVLAAARQARHLS